jgi:hypothetical protein
MNTYSVAVTGNQKNTAKPKAKPIHVTITVEGWDEDDAKAKAVAYLDNIYGTHEWRVDTISVTTQRAPRGARKPVTLHLRRKKR